MDLESRSENCGLALVADTVRFGEPAAPSPDAAVRPWPIRVYTLGRFSLVRDGLPLTFTGKSPRKPLELLQALISLGGRDVHLSMLMGAVWPAKGSTDQRKLFDNTLHRLRKILGYEDAVALGNAKLTLDPRYCWVDAWAFDRLAGELLSEVATLQSKARDAIRLYQGPFLHREPALPWLLCYRDRLHSRFQRLVVALGERLKTAGQWAAAAEVYACAIEVDNLVETFYRGLMVCHQQRGEHAETLRAYRRCRELLSIVLGVKPSAETEAIRRSSLEQGQAGADPDAAQHFFPSLGHL